MLKCSLFYLRYFTQLGKVMDGKVLIFLGVIKFKDEVKALITSFLLFGCSFLTLFFITDQQYSIVVDMEAEKVSVFLLL